jgi:hypothetical protein
VVSGCGQQNLRIAVKLHHDVREKWPKMYISVHGFCAEKALQTEVVPTTTTEKMNCRRDSPKTCFPHDPGFPG